jgi:hypothetical protein
MVLCLLTLVACGGGSGGGGSSGGGSGGGPVVSGLSVTLVSEPDPVTVNGLWKSRVTVTNTTSVSKTFTIVVKQRGVTKDSRSLTLAAGAGANYVVDMTIETVSGSIPCTVEAAGETWSFTFFAAPVAPG